MKKTIVLFLFSLLFTCLYAEDLRISMGSATGVVMNVNVTIADAGTVQGGATYDRTTRSIIHAGDGTMIRISGVDFEGGRYGLYSHLFLEYTLEEEPGDDAFFDIYLENTSTLVASVPVTRTTAGEYAEAFSTMLRNITGSHTMYIKWRNHTASLKTFGAYERKAIAEVKAVRSGSPIQYRFSSAPLEGLTGTHRVKMVWHNQSANVYAIYFDHDGTSGVYTAIDRTLEIRTEDRQIRIISGSLIRSVEIYTVTGTLVSETQPNGYNSTHPLSSGIYLVKITGEKESTVKKVIVK